MIFQGGWRDHCHLVAQESLAFLLALGEETCKKEVAVICIEQKFINKCFEVTSNSIIKWTENLC